MNFLQIDHLVNLSQNPLTDSWLEQLQTEYDQHENYYRFLYHLTLARQPKIVLEIGTFQGVATAHLCAATSTYGGQVIGLDLNQHHTTKELIPQYYDNLHFIEGDSTKAEVYGKVYELVEEYGRIGLVYQDSSHHYEASCQEWAMYTRLLDNEAIWVCDDITPAFWDPLIDPPGKGMVQYFDTLSGNKRLYKDVLHYGNVMGILLW